MDQELFPGQVPHATMTLEQVECLASASRAEVYWNCSPMVPRSIAEIAKNVQRSASATTYHVNELVRVGLLVAVAEQKKHARVEKLYVIAARRGFLTAGFTASPEYREKVFEGYAALLRLMLRERDSLSKAVDKRPELASVSTWRRYSVTTDYETAKKFQAETIERFREFARSPTNPDGVRIAYSFFMTPTLGETKTAKKPKA